jgi:hypothetical protein
LTTHTNSKSNPHGVTKAQVGLGNVDNVKQYSTENPPVVYQPEAPQDTSVIWVDTNDNTVDELQDAVNTALAQAKASGEFDGKNGTSVTVKSVSESTEDGGSNVVTFSDGKQLIVKNGKQGTSGISSEADSVPDYWKEHLDGKVSEIRTALENAEKISHRFSSIRMHIGAMVLVCFPA